MLQNWRQGSVAKHLNWDGSLHHEFLCQLAGESILKIGKHLATFRAYWLKAKFHYTDPTRTGHGQSPRTLSGTS